jgi:outer membrane receptor for ferrienterochelin and colicins
LSRPNWKQQAVNTRFKTLVLVAMTAHAIPALAQPAQVVVSASPAASAQREFVAGKIIIDRRRIEESGVRTVEEILKREPAVTVSGDGRIGLLNMPGYTQILVDGQAPQGGKTGELDVVHVEKIEIVKSSMAEYGPFGIAGTINIVSRKTARKTSTRLTAGAGVGRQYGPNLSLAHQQSGAGSPLSFNLNLSASQSSGREQSQLRQTLREAGLGEQAQWQASVSSRNRTPALDVSGGVTWQRAADETITFTPSLWKIGGDSSASEARRLAGGGTLEVLQCGSSSLDLLRLPFSWSFKPGQTSSMEFSAGANIGRLAHASERSERAPGQPGTVRGSAEHADSSSSTAAVVYRVKPARGHDVKAGASVTRRKRDVEYAYSIDGRADPALEALGTQRFSLSDEQRLYVQDEWRVNDSVALNAGLAGTQLAISAAEGAYRGRARFRLWSPSLHLSKKVGADDAHQFRLSLARSFTPPDADKYTLRPLIHALAPCPASGVCGANTIASADTAGNIGLQPERALGLNLAYEHGMGDASQFTLELFARRIGNKVGERIALESVAWSDVQRYVARPANLGRARTTGLEAEMELSLRDLDDAAPKVTLRASVGLASSRVDSLPGPDNRLDKQTPWTAKLGATYAMQGVPLKFNVNANWSPAVWLRSSLAERVGQPRRFELDTGAIWTISRQRRLVLDLKLRAPRSARQVNEYTADEGQYRLYADARKYQQLKLIFETSL